MVTYVPVHVYVTDFPCCVMTLYTLQHAHQNVISPKNFSHIVSLVLLYCLT